MNPMEVMMMEMFQDLIRFGWLMVQAGVIILILLFVVTVTLLSVSGLISGIRNSTKKKRELKRNKESLRNARMDFEKELDKLRQSRSEKKDNHGNLG